MKMKTGKVFLCAATFVLSLTAFSATGQNMVTVHKAFVSSSASGEGMIHIFRADGAELHHERVFLRSYEDGHIRKPVIATYANGEVYVTDVDAEYTKARILVYSMDGVFQRVLTDGFRDGETESVSPVGMVASPDGANLYLSFPFFEGNNRIYRVDVATGEATCIVNSDLMEPIGLDISSDGTKLYVANRYNAAGRVDVFDVSGETVTKLTKACSTPLAQSVCVDEVNDRIFVGAYNRGYRVFRLSTGEELFASTDTPNVYALKKIGENIFYMKSNAAIISVDLDDSEEALSCSDDPLFVGWGESFAAAQKESTAGCFNAFSVTEPAGPQEIGRWKMEDAAGSGMFTNSVSSAMPIRAYNVMCGASGIEGNGIYRNSESSYGVIEGSAGMLEADYGVFMWVGGVPDGKTGTLMGNVMTASGTYQPGRWHLFVDASGWISFESYGFANMVLRAGSAPVDDGKWHHAGITKKGRTVTLYVDGVARATGEYKLHVDGTVDFTIGTCPAGYMKLPAGTFMDDIRVFRGAPDADAVKAMYDAGASNAAEGPSVVPSHTVADYSVADSYGKIMQWRRQYQCRMGPPMLIATDSEWLVAAAQRYEKWSSSTEMIFRRSENRGESWGELPFYPKSSEAVMFAAGGNIHMLGKMSGSGFTSGSATYKDMEQGMASRCVYRIFDVSGKSGGAVFTNAVNITDYRRENVIDTVSMQSILPGGAVTNGGRIYIPYSTRDGQGVISAKITDSGIEDWDPQPVSPLLHAETPIVPLVVDAAGAVTAVDVSSADLPGADRPFTVKRDPVKGVYWAVTTPQNASMELYASRDLKTWLHAQTVFTVTDTDTTAVSNPAMEISDGDIAIAFNLCCPDGGPCVLDAERPNYAMFRKVTDFRKLSPIKTGTVISIR